VLSYVGAGGGSYRQDTTYKFVGDGAGEFDLVNVPSRCKCNMWVCCCTGTAAFLLLCFASLLALGTETTTSSNYSFSDSTTEKTPQLADEKAVLYDCDAGYTNWQHGWSLGKKAWCCDHASRGCPPKTTKEPYNCKVHGDPKGASRWSFSQKAFCCAHHHTGCPTTAAPTPKPAPDPNCAVGAQSTWTLNKKVWCCTHHLVGCPATSGPQVPAPVPATPALPYDCNAGFDNWEAGWSISKKTWCCSHGGRGCAASPTTTTPCEYNCDEGYSNWARGWSEGKKAFCCSTRGLACPGR